MTRPKIDRDVVLHVASLASLSLSGHEVDRFAAELAKIVTYVEQLDALDTRGVAATAHVQLQGTPWREDDVRPGLSHEDALAQAPRVDAEGFAVPAFVE